jgi:hypothetical protein
VPHVVEVVVPRGAVNIAVATVVPRVLRVEKLVETAPVVFAHFASSCPSRQKHSQLPAHSQRLHDQLDPFGCSVPVPWSRQKIGEAASLEPPPPVLNAVRPPQPTRDAVNKTSRATIEIRSLVSMARSAERSIPRIRHTVEVRTPHRIVGCGILPTT